MNDSCIDYARFVDAAMRDVVRKALDMAQDGQLPGNHHFYITFRTDHEDCQIPQFVMQRYPEEMTIVLQYQFWDLKPEEYGFWVSLSFGGEMTQLYIAYNALISFADPSVNFGLQFHVIYNDDDDDVIDQFHMSKADNDFSDEKESRFQPHIVKEDTKDKDISANTSMIRKTAIKKASKKISAKKSGSKTAITKKSSVKKQDDKKTSNVISLTDFRKKNDNN